MRIRFIQILIATSFVLFLTGTALSADYWQKQVSPTHYSLKNVFFINHNTGWISGDSGFIARTTNAGGNWTVQNTNMSNNIQTVFFINERIGWAVAWEIFPDSNSYLGTIVLQTSDGGNKWTHSMFPDSSYFYKTIFFLDSLEGFMGAAPMRIIYTTNGGGRWFIADTDTTLAAGFPVENISFVTPELGFACGGFRDLAGIMWRTTNGGRNWLADVVSPEPMNDLYIFSPSKLIAAGGDFEYGSSIVKTSNSGSNWIYDTLGTFGVASSVSFRTPAEGWITLGVAQTFSYTLDSGKTWNHIFTPDSVPMLDVCFPDSSVGWSVGYYGALLKYTGNAVNIAGTDEIHKTDFRLYQNYPNPFNPVTRINFSIAFKSKVRLTVYDMLGREVQVLYNGFLNAGMHEYDFSGAVYPSGIYLCKLETSYGAEVRKMILLK